jgi:hypothetical protein
MLLVERSGRCLIEFFGGFPSALFFNLVHGLEA